MEKRFWLMKSEPDVFGIGDLRRKRRSPWDGVRNYQARNFMREMKVGDMVIFYHSNAAPSGAAGLARVSREAYPDHTAWDAKSPYFDPRSTREKPLWWMVDVEFVSVFPRFVTLEEIKNRPELSRMMVVRKGSRLSVQPVEADDFRRLVELGTA